jgi:hypothetical protein
MEPASAGPKPRAQDREFNDTPKLKAFCRVAPTVRLSDFAIFAAGVFFFARFLRSRTSSLVHSRRFDAFLAMTFSISTAVVVPRPAGRRQAEDRLEAQIASERQVLFQLNRKP